MTLHIGVAGLGTVGACVVQLLQQQAALLTNRCGQTVKVVAVSARNRHHDRGFNWEGIAWEDNPVALAQRADVDVVVELIGGADGIAKALCEEALTHGKAVVTANKALLAHHGLALAQHAEHHHTTLAFEAAVGGGIPIIKTLREGSTANHINRIAGILNGTCNYILSELARTGAPFSSVLQAAQEAGYAEADPAFDIDGIDAAHKLALLASVAFGCAPAFKHIKTTGIQGIEAHDIKAAHHLGYAIKLLGMAERAPGSAAISQRVAPYLVPYSHPLAHVNGAFNAISFNGDYVGSVLAQGYGAGARPTASAVVADIVDIACKRTTPLFGQSAAALTVPQHADDASHTSALYLRLMVPDKAGVVAQVSRALADAGVSIRTLHQDMPENDQPVPLLITTQHATEAALQQARDHIQQTVQLQQPLVAIRMLDDSMLA